MSYSNTKSNKRTVIYLETGAGQWTVFDLAKNSVYYILTDKRSVSQINKVFIDFIFWNVFVEVLLFKIVWFFTIFKFIWQVIRFFVSSDIKHFARGPISINNTLAQRKRAGCNANALTGHTERKRYLLIGVICTSHFKNRWLQTLLNRALPAATCSDAGRSPVVPSGRTNVVGCEGFC